MNQLFLFCLSFFAVLVANAQTIPYQELPRPAARPGMDLVFQYESPRDLVLVKNGKITHISKIHHYDEDRPWVATPVHISQQTVLDQVPLNGTQLQALQEMIQSSDFLYLPLNEYGAPQDERAYPYHIKIITGDQEKSVFFYSNPTYAPAPVPFARMEEYVWKLVTEVEQ
ncbi:MAG TPA: hypothetical protein PKA00_13640 [Saprospiraceae bacterium]|nr:hypothetical protein [Saprospiraceae bacterium]HMQ83953.1 hypothetical protein [Saprospiraceae bacterium]